MNTPQKWQKRRRYVVAGTCCQVDDTEARANWPLHHYVSCSIGLVYYTINESGQLMYPGPVSTGGFWTDISARRYPNCKKLSRQLVNNIL